MSWIGGLIGLEIHPNTLGMAHRGIPWEAGSIATRLLIALLSPELFAFHNFQLHKDSALFLHAPRSRRIEMRLSYKQSPEQAVSP